MGARVPHVYAWHQLRKLHSVSESSRESPVRSLTTEQKPTNLVEYTLYEPCPLEEVMEEK